MKSRSPEEEVDNTPPIALQLAVQAIPAVTLPEERLDWSLAREGKDSQRPAFLMPTAEVDSPRAVTGRTFNTRRKALSDQATRTNLGRLGHTPNFSHARVMIHEECIERIYLSRGSLRVRHRRVAFRAVTLEEKKREGRRKLFTELESF